MPEYNFQTLNDKEFEKLSRDLLQSELKITFESFKSGRDKGIDLRYSKPSHKGCDVVIVQAKHWYKSGLKKLLRELELVELPKVKKLNPQRYIITTSVELNVADKDKIINIFKSFIISTSDIYGKDELNNLLGKFPEIEKSYYKLWLSSTNILHKIISNGIDGRSEFISENIRKNISLYVPNKKYKKALKILGKKHFVTIMGEPGVGKTVMARMMIYSLLAKGYELINIDEKISEGEKMWKSEKKQVFYFDDFLGSNYLEITQPKNSDSSLINFIERVIQDPSKRLILTSRTNIVNQAMQKFYKLQNQKIKMSEHEVSIEDYNEWDKAKILYNHLFFSKINKGYFDKIVENKNYWKIIKHKNYSPRIIEFITEPTHLAEVNFDKYLLFILDKLDNPSLIWSHAYEEQIDSYARFLIVTLFSLPSGDNECLKKAFDSRLDYEISQGGFKRENNIYNIKIKELTRSFIMANNINGRITYDFFNPSIIDFLINYITNYPDEKWRILESAVFIEQFTSRFQSDFFNKYILFGDKEKPILYELIKIKENELTSCKNESVELKLLELYCHFFKISEIENDIIRILRKIKFNKAINNSFNSYSLILLLDSFSGFEIIKKYIIDNWQVIIDSIFSHVNEEEDFLSVLKIFEVYSQDYNVYIANSTSKSIVEKSLEYYWENKIDLINSDADDNVSSCSESSELDIYFNELYSKGKNFNKRLGFNNVKTLDKVLNLDTELIASNNYERNRAEDATADMELEEYQFGKYEDEQKVNDLFAS
ncbi:MAG: restriction endonuclease [Candidatus Magasanikiibacteriota bacterium]